MTMRALMSTSTRVTFAAIKILILVSVAVAVSSCATGYHGGVLLDGRPAKIILREKIENMIFLAGYEVTINNNYLGTAWKTAKFEASQPQASGLRFEITQSSLGVVEIVQNVDSGVVVLDVYLNRAYVGTVQKAMDSSVYSTTVIKKR